MAKKAKACGFDIRLNMSMSLPTMIKMLQRQVSRGGKACVADHEEALVMAKAFLRNIKKYC